MASQGAAEIVGGFDVWLVDPRAGGYELVHLFFCILCNLLFVAD
jgi:hypothetical protein